MADEDGFLLPPHIQMTNSMRDLLTYLVEHGVGSRQAMIDVCLELKEVVPILSKVPNIVDRVSRALDVLALFEEPPPPPSPSVLTDDQFAPKPAPRDWEQLKAIVMALGCHEHTAAKASKLVPDEHKGKFHIPSAAAPSGYTLTWYVSPWGKQIVQSAYATKAPTAAKLPPARVVLPQSKWPKSGPTTAVSDDQYISSMLQSAATAAQQGNVSSAARLIAALNRYQKRK